MSSSWASPFAVLLLLGSTGCASRSQAFSSRFITEGTPTVNVGGIETPVFGQPLEQPRAALPPLPDITTVMARASSNLGTLEMTSAALQHALAALEAQPSSGRVLDVAIAYLREGVPDRAYDHLAAGLRHDKTNAALHDTLARVWRDWGFPDRALSSAHAAVYYAPHSAEARNTLGTVLWALGQRNEAGRAFAASTELNPEAAYGWQNLCAVALADGRTAAAIGLCRRATALRKARKDAPR